MRAVAIIPVKGAAAGKSRLAPVLSGAERARLVLWMLERVVRAACQDAGLDVHVVGGDDPVARLCGELRCRWSPDRGGLNPSVEAALHQAAAEGYQVAVVLPADVPYVQAGDVLQLLEALQHPGVVALVPSPDGGTNALAMRLPPSVTPSFGPQSFARHREAVRHAGLEAVVLQPAGLVRDVDEPGDLTPELMQRALRPTRSECGAAPPAGCRRAGSSPRRPAYRAWPPR